MFNITFFNRVNKIYSNDKPFFITFCILYKLSVKDQWRSTKTLISVDLCFDLFSKLKKKILFQCIWFYGDKRKPKCLSSRAFSLSTVTISWLRYFKKLMFLNRPSVGQSVSTFCKCNSSQTAVRNSVKLCRYFRHKV